MSYMLTHLHSGWAVDQAILSEESRIVIIRFGHDYDPECMLMDECLFKIANKIREMAVIYLVDITEVPHFNKMYELYDPCTVMFFYRNRHVMIDLGTGNNNKSLHTPCLLPPSQKHATAIVITGLRCAQTVNWALTDKQEMIDIVETVYRGARKGHHR